MLSLRNFRESENPKISYLDVSRWGRIETGWGLEVRWELSLPKADSHEYVNGSPYTKVATSYSGDYPKQPVVEYYTK